MGGKNSYESRLKIQNDTNEGIEFKVEDYVKTDWDGRGNPLDVFHQKTLCPMSTFNGRLEIKGHGKSGKCSLTMTLQFQNGLVDSFSLNQKYAIGASDVDFIQLVRAHDITYKRVGNKTLVVIIKYTKLQLDNQKATRLDLEAIQNYNQKQYLQALQKIEAALKLANEKSTIQDLKKNKSNCYIQLGKIAMKNGHNLENQGKSDAAMKEFNQAKTYFENANQLGFVNSKLNIEILNAKIDGSKLFNEAVTLNGKALDMQKKNQSTRDNNIVAQIKNNYQQALSKYEQAKKIFENGFLKDQIFSKSIKVTDIAINDVKQSIEKAIANELRVNFSNMLVNDEKNQKTNDVDKKKEFVEIVQQIN